VTFRAELPAEDAASAAIFLGWGVEFFARLGVRFRQLMTDGHKAYRSLAFQRILAAEGIAHITTPPYTPRWNGKVERYFRTMLEEAAYARAYRSDAERRCRRQTPIALRRWPATRTSNARGKSVFST